MGCKLAKTTAVDVYSKSTIAENETNEEPVVKQKPFLVPRGPLQYTRQPPSVQKYLYPMRYQREDDIYLNRYTKRNINLHRFFPYLVLLQMKSFELKRSLH